MKTILLTGATDGIGLQTAQALVKLGHNVLIHGRSQAKLDIALQSMPNLNDGQVVKGYLADLSDLSQVVTLAEQIKEDFEYIDVLINNAGVFSTPNVDTSIGIDVRFVVNTIAPYLLTRQLNSCISSGGRVVNLSSAAQAPVNFDALNGKVSLSDGEAYAQSKLAITMWTQHMAINDRQDVVYVAINPASFLGSKMVKDAYGVAGNDIQIGVDILTRAALSDEFSDASGKYYDNDNQRFSEPHMAGRDLTVCAQLVENIEEIITR